jgi:beta-lactam-binding protein with PASTA domain
VWIIEAIFQFSVVEQDPSPGTMVKVEGKFTLKVNTQVFICLNSNLIEKTYREAVPTLSVRLDEGTVTYVPNLGKDMKCVLKEEI